MIFKRIAGGIAAAESGTISIDDVDAFAGKLRAAGGFLQLCSLQSVHCHEQAFTALEHALTSVSAGTSFTRSPALEFLLRLSAERQLDSALEMVGLKTGKQQALAMVHAKTKPELRKKFAFLKSLGFSAEPPLLEKSRKKNRAHICKLYSIEEAQLRALHGLPDALCSAIVERIALTALQERSGEGNEARGKAGQGAARETAQQETATGQKNELLAEAGK